MLVSDAFCVRVIVLGESCRIIVSVPRGYRKRIILSRALRQAAVERGIGVCTDVLSIMYEHEVGEVFLYGFRGDEVAMCFP